MYDSASGGNHWTENIELEDHGETGASPNWGWPGPGGLKMFHKWSSNSIQQWTMGMELWLKHQNTKKQQYNTTSAQNKQDNWKWIGHNKITLKMVASDTCFGKAPRFSPWSSYSPIKSAKQMLSHLSTRNINIYIYNIYRIHIIPYMQYVLCMWSFYLHYIAVLTNLMLVPIYSNRLLSGKYLPIHWLITIFPYVFFSHSFPYGEEFWLLNTIGGETSMKTSYFSYYHPGTRVLTHSHTIGIPSGNFLHSGKSPCLVGASSTQQPDRCDPPAKRGRPFFFALSCG